MKAHIQLQKDCLEMKNDKLSKLVDRYKSEIKDIERKEGITESRIIGALDIATVHVEAAEKYRITQGELRQQRVAKQHILFALEAVLDERLDKL